MRHEDRIEGRMARRYSYATVDVFTDRRFGGNPLAVVTDASGLSDAEMQALAAEFNYSETTFVLPPVDPAHTARVRIFNRTHEMPFAGHPNVGTGYVLAREGRDRGSVLLFEELAGLVEVRVQHDGAGGIAGAAISAPQPLSLGGELPADAVASCLGLEAAEIVLTRHAPTVASVGVPFVMVEVDGAALERAAPQPDRFRRLVERSPELLGRLSIYLYAPDGPARARARMFAPLAGTWEDPATGSAAAALAAFLVLLGTQDGHGLAITQGVGMGRPSMLHVAAMRGDDGIRAIVRGDCVPVFRGEVVF